MYSQWSNHLNISFDGDNQQCYILCFINYFQEIYFLINDKNGAEFAILQ